ncbi:MAG: hypothetical protein AAF754_00525 [Pseudomonadota bacterium]
MPKFVLALSDADCIEIFERFQTRPAICQGLPVANQIEDDDVLGINSDRARALSSLTGSTSLSNEQRENNIFFLEGGVVVNDAVRAKIEELAMILRSSLFQGTCIQLVGHSDAVGDEALNFQLGLQRAQVVASELSVVVNKQRIAHVTSNGELALLPNIPPSHPYQRRVEVRVRDCSGQF